MNRITKKLDVKLILVFFLLFLIGIISIYSSTYNEKNSYGSIFFYRQIIWMVVGIIGIILLMKISCQRILEWSYLIYFINVILLILVLFFGISRGGGYRWLRIGIFNFQPSEFAKLSLVLVTVRFLISSRKNNFKFDKAVILLIILFIPVILVALQPDLGTSLVFIPIVFGIWFISGLGFRYLVTFTVLGLLSSPLLWLVLKDYQKQRLLVFIKPELDPLGAGYTVVQSKIAVGSGGIIGKGWLSGTQNILNFLPERHTDFIFSIIGEEWGFLGTLFVLGLYIYLIKRGLTIAANANQRYDKLLAAGIIILLAIHIIINIGMTMGIMPAVGLPLPFISYGGSNLVAIMICIGVLLEIYRKAHSS